MNNKNDKIKSDNLKNWLYDFELERTPFKIKSHENEQIEGMLSVSKIWENFDPYKDDLEVEIVKEWIEEDVVFRRFYFTSRTVEDGKVRIYAVYGANKNKKSPALFHIHGGGQTANEDWIRYLTANGYAVLSIDWGGTWEHKVNGCAIYPKSLYYANHQFTDRMFCGGPSIFGSPWYEWCYACMRGITYLEQQPEVDDSQIGIYGISMGGSMVWNIAAIDKRVKASVAIYGAGWANYPHKFKHITYEPNDQTKIWLSGITPEIYAQYINSPIMVLSSTNDFHGNMDRMCDTFDALPATTIRRLSFGVSHNHHIEYDQVPNLLHWFDSQFKTNKVLPKNPQIIIKKGMDDIPEIRLTVEDETKVLWVKMFYALENTNPRNRYWQEVAAEKCELNTYAIKAPVMDTNKYLFAYASVKYKDGLHLSSKLEAIIPKELFCKATANKSKIIYDASEGKKGWAARHWTTDPIPLAPHYVYEDHLLEPKGGGVSTVNNKKIITSRLNDPRFLNSENANLIFDFFATEQGKVSISFGDEPLKEKIYSGFNITYDLTIEIGKTTALINPNDLGISNWLDYPQIVILGLNEEKIKLCKIYWE